MSKNLLSLNVLKQGSIVTGEIIGTININNVNHFILYIGGKSEAYIKSIEGLKVGDFIDVLIKNICDKEGRTIVSYEEAQTAKFLENLKSDLENNPNKTYEVLIDRKNKKGFIVKFFSLKEDENGNTKKVFSNTIGLLEYFKTNRQNPEIGSVIKVAIEKMNGNLISVYIPKEMPSNINVGDILVCEIKTNVNGNCYYLSNNHQFKDFILPISETQKGVTYLPGEKIKVLVIKKTPSRITVSAIRLKQEEIMNSLKIDNFYPATVKSIGENTLSVIIEDKFEANLSKKFSKALLEGNTEGLIGKVLYVKIIRIIGLNIFISMHSRKELKDIIKKGDNLTGLVIDKNSDFIIARHKDLEIIINKNNFHRDLTESYKVFEAIKLWSEIDLEILNIDLDRGRIYAAIKNVLKLRKDYLDINDIYSCLVKKVFHNGVLVEISNKSYDFIYNGFINKNELTVDFNKIKTDDVFDAKITKKEELITLSAKALKNDLISSTISSFSLTGESFLSDLFK